MNYTQKQYEWATGNEANIWNYFVESNLIFGDDPDWVSVLSRRDHSQSFIQKLIMNLHHKSEFLQDGRSVRLI
jgi:hypothetical protein